MRDSEEGFAVGAIASSDKVDDLRSEISNGRIGNAPLLTVVIVCLVANRDSKIAAVKIVDKRDVVRICNIVNHYSANTFQSDKGVDPFKEPRNSHILRFRPFVVTPVVKIICSIVQS
jgi:hypothetical protein